MNRVGTVALAIGLLAAFTNSAWSAPLSDAITYQGRLDQAGAPYSGPAAMTFRLYDAAVGGELQGQIDVPSVAVDNGMFTVALDFGTPALAFNGEARWLEILVNGTPLTPRQPISAAPYSHYSLGPWAPAGPNIAYTAGSVGIGTVSPSSETRLHIRTPDHNFGVLADALGVPGSSIGLHVGTAGWSSLAKNAYFVTGIGWNRFDTTLGASVVETTPDGDIVFGVIGPGSNPVLFPIPMIIRASGNIGVGDVFAGATAAELHVRRGPAGTEPQGDSPLVVETSGNGYINIITPAASQRGILFGEPGELGTAAGGIIYNASSTPDGLQFRANGNDIKMVIQGDGQVGIGVTAPVHLLTVNGTAGKPGGGSWSTFSDARLKRDVHDLDGALDDLLALRGISFEYRDPTSINERPGRQIGMIAQEVEPLFPQWVATSDNGFKSLSYSGFEALTVEALRDLRAEKDAEIAALSADKDAQIDSLRHEIDREIIALRAENQGLRERLAALESIVNERLHQR